MTELIPATDEAFWGDADLRGRIVQMKFTPRTGLGRPDGVQILVYFVNGYGMSIINDGGHGVEVMVLDREDGTIAGGDVPRQALVWVRQQLADDTVIFNLTPVELRDLIFDVAYWPNWRAGRPADRIGQQIVSYHQNAYHSGEWGTITGVAPAPEHPFRTCYSITWPNGDTDLWPVADELAQYEFRHPPEEVTDGRITDAS